MQHLFLAVTICLFATFTACFAQRVSSNNAEQAESQKIESAVERAFEKQRRTELAATGILAVVFGTGIVGNKIVQRRKKQAHPNT
jgi:heme/copper-type cytochrome/quinol oxidase subunit 3